MKRCKICRKKPKLDRRVNSDGIVFCSDDCYEEYEHHPDDHNHPYIDDYEAIRYAYSQWVGSYKDDLFEYGPEKKNNLIESIDSVIEEFYDYARLAGSDGIFSYEIYQYLLAFEELQEEINNWMIPSEKKLKKQR